MDIPQKVEIAVVVMKSLVEDHLEEVQVVLEPHSSRLLEIPGRASPVWRVNITPGPMQTENPREAT